MRLSEYSDEDVDALLGTVWPAEICLWCEPDSPSRVLRTVIRYREPLVSHGICQPCSDRLLANIRQAEGAQ